MNHSFLNFKTDKNSFSIISYNVLNESLETKLKKNKRIKIQRRKYEGFYQKLLKKNYEIIIITDTNNFLFKKYFSKQFKKTTIVQPIPLLSIILKYKTT